MGRLGHVWGSYQKFGSFQLKHNKGHQKAIRNCVFFSQMELIPMEKVQVSNN